MKRSKIVSILAMSLFVIFLVLPNVSAEGNTIPSNEVTLTQQQSITPNYVPCPIWGSQHRFVSTGWGWTDYDVYYYSHEHAWMDGFGGIVYSDCDVYGDKRHDQYLCACGEEQIRISWSNLTHHILR